MNNMVFYNSPASSQSRVPDGIGQDGSPQCPLVTCPPPSRQRRSRTMFTDEDIRRLEEYFLRDPYPDIYGREQLATAIGVPEARIQTWFQNKRSRTRRRMNNQMGARSPPVAGSRSSPVPVENLENVHPRAAMTFSPTPVSPLSPRVFPLQSPPVRRSPNIDVITARDVTSPKRRMTSPRTEDDANDSGVLDLSTKSNESPKEDASPATKSRSALRARQASRFDPDTGRPFFTPWAASTASPPGNATAAKKAANDALVAAVAASRMRATSDQLPPATAQYSAANPWLYGFAPTFNAKDGVYYFQPLPTSPFLQHVADTALPASPGLSPLAMPTGNWSPSFLSPTLPPILPPQRHFIFPDVPSPEVMAANRQRTQMVDVTSPVRSEGQASSSSSKTDALSESPGSDAGSRSSGYSSRECDSPIDVCN